MQGLIEQFKSPAFWIFSVVIGLILNVLGNYATRFVDRSFQFGTSRIRVLSTRSREKRAAQTKHIHCWIDGHQSGAVLVLSEAHFLSFLGMIMIALVITLLLWSKSEVAASSSLFRVLLAALALLTAGIGIAAMNVGGTLLDAVRSHPKGLKGLRPYRLFDTVSK